VDSANILRKLLGREPYRWQSDLHRSLLSGDIPDALDIPTGLGKTAVIAIWLAVRLAGASLPRRLVYVVDRRAVVDQATTEAIAVAAKLENARAVLPSDEAELWRRTLCLDSNRLPISTLRGQFTDNRLWLQNPVQSSIIVGTVDMIGSRLLFEGYGVNPRMRPVHAALLGTDSLIVIDEAHLIPPFQSLIRQVACFDRPAPVPAMRFMALSATGRTVPGETIFSLTPDRRQDPAVRHRLDSPKEIMLRNTDGLARSLAERAFELGQNGARVLVFCNSRYKVAGVVADDLRKRAAKIWKDQPSTALLVGARRVAEREGLTGRRDPGGHQWIIRPDPVFERFLSSEDPCSSGVPAFLIATSAGEVGVDLDADHMVCDLVPWERMVQRLGRVNRSGRETTGLVDVFVGPSADDAETDVSDQIAVLRAPFEGAHWPTESNGRRAAGPRALLDLKSQEGFEQVCRQATTPEPLCPELRRVHVDAWCMTSLEEHPGRPKVEPWIRGWIDPQPQCRMVWRGVLPMRGQSPDKGLLNEFFEALPPHLVETLETETYRALEVLKARAKALPAELRKELESLAVVVIDSHGEVEDAFGLNRLDELDNRSGRTWVIDARIGGLSRDGLLDSASSEPPVTLDQVPDSDVLWQTLFEEIGRSLRIVRVDAPPAEGWKRETSWPKDPSDDEGGEEWRVEKKLSVEADRDASRSSRNQRINDHHSWAENEAAAMAEALSLSSEYRLLLCAASRVHDLGKDRELWQTAMGAPRAERPLAKVANNKANGRALNGYRHEFGSLGDGETVFNSLPGELRDLARHIVVAHHGFARPVIAAKDPNTPPSLVTPRAREAALRFTRLQAHWGPWGLAWWETLLRAVDWKASAALDLMPAQNGKDE
jgi:CRISPR-associated endonuclease/helicase Cas3